MIRKVFAGLCFIGFLAAFGALTQALVSPVNGQNPIPTVAKGQGEIVAPGWLWNQEQGWHSPYRPMVCVSLRTEPLELSSQIVEELSFKAYADALRTVGPDERDCWNGDLNALATEYPKLNLKWCTGLGVDCLRRRTLWLLHYEQGQLGAITPEMDAILRKYLRLNPARIEYEN